MASAMLLFGVNASAATVEDRNGRVPGLPFVECIGFPSVPCSGPDDPIVNDFGWLNLPQNGITGSVPSKQWGRVPMAMMATATEFGFEFYDGPWVSNQTIDLRIRAFFTSPAGSRHNYGDSPLIPVRTVAFGSIPTVVTLQVSQPRKSNGDPIPFTFTSRSRAINFPEDRPDLEFIAQLEKDPQPLRSLVEVKVVRVDVDGVDVRLGTTCTTGPTANLFLTTRPTTVEIKKGEGEGDPVAQRTNPDESFYSASGGSLHGSIDIPAFQGCMTQSGDDLSPLLTSAISGKSNPISAKTGIVSCAVFGADGRSNPNPPGVNSPYDPQSGCNTGLVNGNYKAVPSELPIPDFAPGDQPSR